MVPTRVIRSNDFPTAVPDSVTVNEDTPVTVSVLANDSGLTDAPITVSVLEGPSHGTARVDAGGRIIYTPAANYFGPDALTYVVADADGDQSMATLNIAVSSLNDPPVAADQALFTPEETTINGFLAASDADGDGIAYAVTTPPAHGTATVDGAGFFTYTPAAEYNGNDTFVITTSDGRGGTDTVNIGISVGSLNDPPVAGDQSLSTGEETPVSGTIVATDPEGDTFTYSVSTTPAHGTASVDAAGSFTYTPALDYVGPDSFVVTVDDGHGGTDTATINVTVTNTNDPPTITVIGPASTNEDTPITVGFTVGDVETLPGSLVVSATSSNEAVVDSDSGISYGGSGASRNVNLNPVASASGSTTITVTVSDGIATASQSFVLTVNAINDPPTITAIADASTNEDTPVTVNFTIGDVETLPGSLVVSATSSNDAVVDSDSGISYGGSGVSRNVTLNPVANASGSTTITVTVSDGTATASQSFVLTVTAINDPPTITAIADASTNEDTPLTVNFTIGDVETLPGSLIVSATSSNNAVVDSDTGISFAGSSASRNVTLTPMPNAFGSTTITVTVSDGSLTASESFTLTVNAVLVI
jgi:VCBS repeat-containing protein